MHPFGPANPSVISFLSRTQVHALVLKSVLVACLIAVCSILLSCDSTTTEPETETLYGAIEGEVTYGDFPHCMRLDSVYIREPWAAVRVDSLNRFRFLEMPEGSYEMRVGDTLFFAEVYAGKTTRLDLTMCSLECSTTVSRIIVVDSKRGIEYGVAVHDSTMDLYSDLDSFSLRIGLTNACSGVLLEKTIISPISVYRSDSLLFAGIPPKGWAVTEAQKNQPDVFRVVEDSRTVFTFSMNKRAAFDRTHYLSIRLASVNLTPRPVDDVVNPYCPVSGDRRPEYVGFGADTFLIDYQLDHGDVELMLVERATGRHCSRSNPSDDWGTVGRTEDDPRWIVVSRERYTKPGLISIPNASSGLYDVYVDFPPLYGEHRTPISPNLVVELGPLSPRGVIGSLVSVSPPDSIDGNNRWFAGTIEVPAMIFRQGGEDGK